jgi:hypothetical protein
MALKYLVKSKSYLELLRSPGRASRERKVERLTNFPSKETSGVKMNNSELISKSNWILKKRVNQDSISPYCKRKVIMFIHTWQDNHPEEQPVSSLQIVCNLHEKRIYKKLWTMSTVHILEDNPSRVLPQTDNPNPSLPCADNSSYSSCTHPECADIYSLILPDADYTRIIRPYADNPRLFLFVYKQL